MAGDVTGRLDGKVRFPSIATAAERAHIHLIETETFPMTKTFSTLVLALAITASLAAATSPVAAFTVAGDPIGVANGDLGSGRIADVTGMSSGSGR